MGGGGLEIFKKRSDISILVAFSSGHFRSRGGRGTRDSRDDESFFSRDILRNLSRARAH